MGRLRGGDGPSAAEPVATAVTESHNPLVTAAADRALPVVAPQGEFDMQIAPSLTIELLTAAAGVGGVVLDASGITFADSAVLHALIETHGQTDLRIAAAPAHLMRVINLTGLETVLRLYPTLEAALADTGTHG